VNGGAQPRIAVVRQGGTPRINAVLADVVRTAYPDHVVDDIDVLAELRRRRGRAAMVAALATAEHGAGLARGRIDRKRALLTSAAFTSFARHVVRERIDPADTSFVIQSQSLFAADVPGVPHVVYTDHVHLANFAYPAFDPRHILPASFLRRELELYRRCAVTLVRSTNIRDILQHGYAIEADRLRVVGVGPNAPIRSRPRTERSWHGGRIVFVGKDWQRKGGPTLLQAFAALRGRHPTASLDIVGADPPVSAEAGVTAHGRLPESEVAALLERSDVFCLPTRAEPFGVAFIEAMLAGLPVVGTDLGAQPDFIVPGITGELVPPDDAPALTSALERLLADPAKTRRMGRAAAGLANDHYTWEAVATRLREATDGITAGHATDRGDASPGPARGPNDMRRSA